MFKLLLDDWMGHEHLEITGDTPVTLIVGENGSGKSAIRDALEFLYLGTGKLRKISTKKDLGALSIRGNAQQCRVSLETKRMMLIRQMDRSGKQTLQRAEWDEETNSLGKTRTIPLDKPLTGMAAEIVRTALEPTQFLEMDPTHRREMLLEMTSDEGQSWEEIFKAFMRNWQVESDDEKGIFEAASKMVAKDGFRAAETHYVESRKDSKRELRELPVIPEPEAIEMFESNTLESFEAHLEEVREAHMKALLANTSNVATLEGKLEQAQQTVTDLEAVEFPPKDVDAESRHQATVDRMEELATTGREAAAEVDEAEKKLEEARAPIPTFEHPGKCPAVDFDFKCSVKFATFAKAMPKQIRATPEEIAVLETSLVSCRTLLETCSNDHKAASTERHRAKESLDAAVQRELRVEAHALQIQKAKSDAQKISTDLAVAKKQAENASGDAATVPELAERIDRGVAICQQKRDWDLHWKDFSANDSRRKELTSEIEVLDAIAKDLKPEGIESTLGGGAAEKFMALVSQAAGVSGTIEMASDFGIKVKIDGTSFHPLQLSCAQKLAMGLAFQHAICSMMDFPLLVVDAIDLWDPEHRREFAGFALEAGTMYAGGIIGLATLGTEEPQRPPEGMTTFWLQDGGRCDQVS